MFVFCFSFVFGVLGKFLIFFLFRVLIIFLILIIFLLFCILILIWRRKKRRVRRIGSCSWRLKIMRVIFYFMWLLYIKMWRWFGCFEMLELILINWSLCVVGVFCIW